MFRSLLFAFGLFAAVTAWAEPAIVAVDMAVPGASAEQVEEKFAVAVEKLMQKLPGIVGMQTSARDARLVVEIAFEKEPTAGDMKAVERAMAMARARFKQYTGEPKVTVRPRSPGW
jgi:multidrug efflux pump subunit AcrB